MTPRKWKKRTQAQAAHADDWLITYADMITLLLCFFVVIIINQVPKKNIKPVAPQPVVAIKDPVPPAPRSIPMMRVEAPSLHSTGIFPFDLPFNDEMPEEAVEPAPVALAAAPEQMTPLPASLAEIADTIKPHDPIKLEQKSDRITTLEINSGAFFGSGSAVLSEGGADILRRVATSLTSDAFKDYQVTVEGHTDDTPIHTMQFPSNWELSTARASAVVHFLLDQGIPAQRLRAAGYADTFPKLANRDENGKAIPDNQAANRRVVIKLEKIEKQPD